MRLLGAEVIQTKNGNLEISIARQLKNENPDTMVMLNQVGIFYSYFCIFADHNHFHHQMDNYRTDISIISNSIRANFQFQFDNDVNPRTHFEKTGAEIVSALGDVDVVVLGAGTGGTMTGVGKKLKEKNPKCILVAAEPDGSTMINKNGKPHSFLVIYQCLNDCQNVK